MGRLFEAGDEQSCRSCAVLSYEFWKQRLGADRGIVGRTITVDSRPFRVIGVLSEDFWFFGERPAAWSLFDEDLWPGFSGEVTGAVCRLKPGVAAAAAQEELRALAREEAPHESGSWVTVTPLTAILLGPIGSLGPLFIGLAGFALAWAVSGCIRHREIRAGAFLWAKTVLLLSAIFAASFEFFGAASANASGGATALAGTAFYWLLVVGALAVRWALSDQRKRCRTCLRRLEMPVRIGEGGRMLFEPNGNEMACPSGHGVLFTEEGGLAERRDHWRRLDASWRELFAPAAKTSR